MESRPFQFHLPASAQLPAQDYVYWASTLWMLVAEVDRNILLGIPAAHELPLCQALHARVKKSITSWSGLQGRHEVVVTTSGSYTLSEVAPGLHTGPHVDTSPGSWLCRLITINGQDPVVQGLRGTVLEGAPWEDATALLEEVKKQVELQLVARKPDWVKIATHCERLVLAGFLDDAETNQFLGRTWEKYVGFRDPWSAVLLRHRRTPKGA